MSRPTEAADWPVLGAGDDLLSVRAAAPDMLAALRDAIPGLETLATADPKGWSHKLGAARAAIAAAEGRA